MSASAFQALFQRPARRAAAALSLAALSTVGLAGPAHAWGAREQGALAGLVAGLVIASSSARAADAPPPVFQGGHGHHGHRGGYGYGSPESPSYGQPYSQHHGHAYPPAPPVVYAPAPRVIVHPAPVAVYPHTVVVPAPVYRVEGWGHGHGHRHGHGKGDRLRDRWDRDERWDHPSHHERRHERRHDGRDPWGY